MVSTSDTSQITKGTEIFGADGEKIGKAAGIEADSIVVEKGFFFPTDYYIPTSAIASVDDGKAYLNVNKDDALAQNWGGTVETVTTTDTAPLTTETVDVTTTTATASTDAGWGGMHDDDGAGMEHRQDSDQTHDNTADGVVVQVHEEELTATTRAREIGEVQIEKNVVSEQRTVEVPVSEERVRVERRAVDRPLAAGETAFDGGTIEVPLMGEEVELRKQVRVAEEVEIGKDAVQRTEQVSGTVRREQVRVDEIDTVDAANGSATTDATGTRNRNRGR